MFGVGDHGGFAVGGGGAGAAGVFLAQRGGRAGGEDTEAAGQPGFWAGRHAFAEGPGPVVEGSGELVGGRRGAGGCALRPRDVVPQVGQGELRGGDLPGQQPEQSPGFDGAELGGVAGGAVSIITTAARCSAFNPGRPAAARA